jgi:hypothetical protein
VGTASLENALNNAYRPPGRSQVEIDRDDTLAIRSESSRTRKSQRRFADAAGGGSPTPRECNQYIDFIQKLI